MRSSDRRNRFPFYKIPIGGEWRNISDKWMREELMEESVEDYMALDDLIFRYQINPLSFALPHGAPRKDRHKNDGIAFVNDRESEIMTVTAGSQLGKSFVGAIKMLMHLVPTDPDWPCFKEHGIDWHEWAGPQKAIVASLKFEPNVRIVWETYLQICPRSELGDLAPSYGAFPGENGNGRILNFRTGGTHVVRLACGSEITLLSYHQNINSFESMQADIAHCDEQPKEQQYDAIAARQRTRGDYTPIFATMTPIMIDGRPDTGAAGFLIKDVMGKDVAKGRKVANYKITVDSMPEVFMSEEKKKQMYEECIGEPTRSKNDVQLRHGKARYYGEPEAGGGGIIPINPEVHMIEPFDVEKYRPTWLRFVDHGTKPCAGLQIALMPWGDYVVVDEYYEWNPSIRVHAQKLVEEFCGNERIRISTHEEDGATWPIYEEKCTNRQYYVSECDVNSFNSPSNSSILTIGQIYNQNGYRCVPSGNPHRKESGTIDILKDMFTLSQKREHINKRLKRDVPEASEMFGAPAVYMFNNCKNTLAELVGWIENPKTGKPVDGDDHLISCLLFCVSRTRRYMGDYHIHARQEQESVKRVVDPYSKY